MTETMPKVVRNELDKLNATLTGTIEKTDYQTLFKEELKKVGKQASFKGFRKGKTPASFLKKMYGKQVLSQVVNDILAEELQNFFTNDEREFVGQPIPNEAQTPIEGIGKK